MFNNFKDSSIQGMAKKLLLSSEMQEQFPQMLRLLTIALTIPVSSVDCDRGFSKQNLIKTKIRAKLKTENVCTGSEKRGHFACAGDFLFSTQG